MDAMRKSAAISKLERNTNIRGLMGIEKTDIDPQFLIEEKQLK